jgi:hypothetical protein
VAVALALLASACSVEEVLSVPDCQTGGSAFIVAQSVPTGDLVPCFNPLPAGWEVTSVKINQDGSVFRMDSDRAGDDAAVLRYAERCDLDDAVSIPSDQDGADGFEYIERIEPGFRAERYFVFNGGCVWWEFDFDDDAQSGLAIELDNSLVLVTRESLNQSMRESFIDEEL